MGGQVKMSEKKFNICSTQELIIFIMSFGDKGVSINQMAKETLICNEKWTSSDKLKTIERIERCKRQNILREKGRKLYLTEEYFNKFLKPLIMTYDNPMGYLKKLSVSLIESALIKNPNVSMKLLLKYKENGALEEHIKDRIDDIYDVCLEQCHKRE